MNGLGQTVTHPGDGAHEIGAWTQVSLFAQVLHAVALGGHGIGIRIIDPANNCYIGGLQLEGLT